jgi:hypothetical protein
MKTIAAVLAGVVIGAGALYLGQRLLEPAYMTPDCEALVRIYRVGDHFEVKPKNVCLHVDRRLKWEVNTPPGDKVEIVFDSPDGFAFPGITAENPKPGHYMTTPQKPSEIDSNLAKTEGSWPYKVLWTPAGATVAKEIDPVVCIRKG